MTAILCGIAGIPVLVGLSYATAWCTLAWIQRNCKCDYCEHEDLT